MFPLRRLAIFIGAQRWLVDAGHDERASPRPVGPDPPGGHWNGIAEGKVVVVEPRKRLSYSWDASGEEAGGLRTVVAWTLMPTQGARLRMEQSGFRPEDEAN